MRIAMVGCRDWTDRDAIMRRVVASRMLWPEMTVVTGDAELRAALEGRG